jgi:hypothetical protein
MSQLLKRLASGLQALENAAPEEHDAAETAMTPFLKKLAYRRIPLGTQQQILVSAEVSRDRATVAEFAQYSNEPSIRKDAADALAELSKPMAPRWPSIQV